MQQSGGKHQLSGKKVAILVTNGFEQVELTSPKQALEDAGAKTHIIAPRSDAKDNKIKAWQHTDWGDEFPIDLAVEQADANEYDALLLPGGVMNPDKLRMSQEAVQFVRRFFEQGKPVASICHGPWMLVEADVVDGRKVTSYPSLQTDLRNAGANWVDQEVVVDAGLVTSRNPDDLPAFNRKLVEEVAEGRHEHQRV